MRFSYFFFVLFLVCRSIDATLPQNKTPSVSEATQSQSDKVELSSGDQHNVKQALAVSLARLQAGQEADNKAFEFIEKECSKKTRPMKEKIASTRAELTKITIGLEEAKSKGGAAEKQLNDKKFQAELAEAKEKADHAEQVLKSVLDLHRTVSTHDNVYKKNVEYIEDQLRPFSETFSYVLSQSHKEAGELSDSRKELLGEQDEATMNELKYEATVSVNLGGDYEKKNDSEILTYIESNLENVKPGSVECGRGESHVDISQAQLLSNTAAEKKVLPGIMCTFIVLVSSGVEGKKPNISDVHKEVSDAFNHDAFPPNTSDFHRPAGKGIVVQEIKEIDKQKELRFRGSQQSSSAPPPSTPPSAYETAAFGEQGYTSEDILKTMTEKEKQYYFKMTPEKQSIYLDEMKWAMQNADIMRILKGMESAVDETPQSNILFKKDLHAVQVKAMHAREKAAQLEGKETMLSAIADEQGKASEALAEQQSVQKKNLLKDEQVLHNEDAPCRLYEKAFEQRSLYRRKAITALHNLERISVSAAEKIKREKEALLRKEAAENDCCPCLDEKECGKRKMCEFCPHDTNLKHLKAKKGFDYHEVSVQIRFQVEHKEKVSKNVTSELQAFVATNVAHAQSTPHCTADATMVSYSCSLKMRVKPGKDKKQPQEAEIARETAELLKGSQPPSGLGANPTVTVLHISKAPRKYEVTVHADFGGSLSESENAPSSAAYVTATHFLSSFVREKCNIPECTMPGTGILEFQKGSPVPSMSADSNEKQKHTVSATFVVNVFQSAEGSELTEEIAKSRIEKALRMDEEEKLPAGKDYKGNPFRTPGIRISKVRRVGDLESSDDVSLDSFEDYDSSATGATGASGKTV
eukprot:g569.t1